MTQAMPRHWSEREVVVQRIWTPYGVPVDMELHDGVPALTLPEVISFAGIRDPAARKLCEDEIEASREQWTPWPDFQRVRGARVYRIVRRHGGGRPPVVGLPLPNRPLAPSRPPVGGMEDAGWDSRHHILLEFLHNCLRSDAIDRDPDRLVQILTEQLESWTEGRIRTLPQAAAYAISAHPEWRRKGVTWLLPYRYTWLPDYLALAPWVQSLARIAGKSVYGVPSWL